MTLDPERSDGDGIPAPKIDYRLSENSQRMLEHAVARGKEVLVAAGATETYAESSLGIAGWHLMGTARMGTDPENSVVNEWVTSDEELWERFSRDVDYRRVATTKPHWSHPNYVYFVGDELWVTRCAQGDALCLSERRPPIQIGERAVHDGLVREGSIYFTVVSGEVVVVDPEAAEIRRRYDLNAIAGGGRSSASETRCSSRPRTPTGSLTFSTAAGRRAS